MNYTSVAIVGLLVLVVGGLVVARMRSKARPGLTVTVSLESRTFWTPPPYPQPGVQSVNDDIEAFQHWLDVYNESGGPVTLRNLLLAAIKLMDCNEPLPVRRARDLKQITGVIHKTYATGAQGLLSAKFEGSGNYWSAFLVGRSLYPWPNETRDTLIGKVLDLPNDPGRAAAWESKPHEWPIRKK
jgi:hypothetical protein